MVDASLDGGLGTMQVNRKAAATIRTAIEAWTSSGHLDEPTATALRQDIEISSFDWRGLAKYSFWASLICIVIAISAVLADKALLKLLQFLLSAPHLIKFLSLALLSGTIYWLGFRRRAAYPQKIFSGEAIFFLGVLATAAAIHQLGSAFDTGSGHFSILLLLSFLIYGVLGFFLRSNLIWLFAIFALGGWMGAETGYLSGWGAYYLGMNYPLRFVLFGGILTAIAFSLEQKTWFELFFRSTLVMGLLYLFVALWIMSIFGNYGDVETWERVKQIELFHWSILFGLAAIAAIYHALRYDNAITRGFGITFLLINLYTRFFEYFWDATHKAVFFGLLAISLWYLGSHAEKIWHMGEKKKS